jgi:predicted transposase YbfD/YdcC
MVDDFFSTAIEKKFVAIEHSKVEDNDYGHGRIQSRACYSVALPAYLRDFQDNWVDLKSLACVVSSREINNVITHEKRYYVSSLEPSTEKISHAIRCHWHVENSLHWVMDVTFKEDDSRIRRGVAAENMSVMRHLALNLIKKESQEAKFSVPRKRRKAGLYDEYREKVLGI